jgi:hypothetical protein
MNTIAQRGRERSFRFCDVENDVRGKAGLLAAARKNNAPNVRESGVE